MESNAPPQKKKRRMQKFLSDYSQRWPVLKPSDMGESYARCTVCQSSFSIAHGGANDCATHVNGARHRKYADTMSGQASINTFFVQKRSDEADKVTRAELLWTEFLTEHNIPVSVSDHFGPLIKQMFPDSQIANKFTCGHTKAASLISYCANEITDSISSTVQNKPYSISTDGSNSGADKMYPIVIRYVGGDGLVNMALLSVPCVTEKSCTGENIFNTVSEDLRSKNISWKNCVALGCDNANVMSGKKKGFFGFVQKEAPHCVFSGCPCHLIHLTAKHATDEHIPVNVGEILIDIYYYLKMSAKRQGELAEFQKLHLEGGKEKLKVLKHVPTRWLSLLQGVNRILELWVALREYFHAEKGKTEKTGKDIEGGSNCGNCAKRIYDFLASHTARAYCLFLAYILPIFTKANLALQHEKPLIHKSRRICMDLYRSILVKFLKPAAFTGKQLMEVNVKLSYNLKKDTDISIGEQVRSFCAEKKYSDSKQKALITCVRAFYIRAATYMKDSLKPLTDDFLFHAEICDITRTSQMNFTSVKFIVDKFPAMLPPNCSMDQLESEFDLLQVEELDSKITAAERADLQWARIAQLRDASGSLKFVNISQLMCNVLLVPHSNAACETVFSQVRKIRTQFRPTMSAKTVESICVNKTKKGECYKQTYTDSQLQRARGATKRSLEAAGDS